MNMKKKNPPDSVQGDLFGALLSELNDDDTPLFSKEYNEQQELIDKPIDYVSRKAIELRPLDFLQFFPEFQHLSPEQLKNVKILDTNRTLEAYFKREADSLTLLIEPDIDELRDTVFHIEVQTSYDDTIDERILIYNVLIKHKTKASKVKTLLINLDQNPNCQLLGQHDFGTIKIQYEVKNLWEQRYQDIKQQGLIGLLPFTPYLKGGGPAEIQEASEILTKEITEPQEQAEMLFLLAILAGRKYNTAGFKLLSPLTLMNTESLRNDPTAKELIHLLFPDEIAEAEAKGIEQGIKKSTESFIHRFGNVLSEEQIQQLKKEVGIMPTQ
jgi:transposase